MKINIQVKKKISKVRIMPLVRLNFQNYTGNLSPQTLFWDNGGVPILRPPDLFYN